MEYKNLRQGRHKDKYTMVIEYLEESIYIVKYCLEYRKNESWGKPHVKNGRLGYPAFTLMMNIIDCINSFICKNPKYQIKAKVNGEQNKISHSSGYRVFYILNSKFFNLNLSDDIIKELYINGRNSIIHNGHIGRDIELLPTTNHLPIEINSIKGKGKIRIYLPALLKKCEEAVTLFKTNAEDIIKNSKNPNFESIEDYKK
ncbi:hypothetical protein [Membranihabitans marinus]|uniref:hypothetical protein n=1 Tax=Membranihabitans marinus TaxID=1227546 RepID=UPI001F1CB076|nr:hypothetical protein [Membranihabitans marinus]